MRETGGTFKLELHDGLANDEHGVALATVSGTRDSRALSDRYAHIVHFNDGRITEA
jgi:ketosteroid isomerase-like protein